MAETQIEAEAETQVRQILKLPIQFIIYDLIRSGKINFLLIFSPKQLSENILESHS